MSRWIKLQKTDRYLRIKLWALNVYFSLYPLSVRKSNEKKRDDKNRRISLKRQLLSEIGYCQKCGEVLTWDTASIHHKVPTSIHPELRYNRSNLMLLCTECHIRLHQIADLATKLN